MSQQGQNESQFLNSLLKDHHLFIRIHSYDIKSSPTSSIQQIRQNINFDKILNVHLSLCIHTFIVSYTFLLYIILWKTPGFLAI